MDSTTTDLVLLAIIFGGLSPFIVWAFWSRARDARTKAPRAD